MAFVLAVTITTATTTTHHADDVDIEVLECVRVFLEFSFFCGPQLTCKRRNAIHSLAIVLKVIISRVYIAVHRSN